MCGIFFSLGFDNLPDAVIDSVAHRGPDGRGWKEFSSPQGPAVMGHRRLAIVDLSPDGRQPMASEDGRYWISYNGEIYNYREIRKELEKHGRHFKTKTDTEVLLQSYLHWKKECLPFFNGMFAFVIWDDKDKKIFAARDRFGVKPLYYYRQGDKIAFASEIKQFKKIPHWQSFLNHEMADAYLQNGCCDHRAETLYQNVFQVLGGEYLTFDGSGKSMRLVRWYDLKNKIYKKRRSDPEAITAFKELFENSIRLRLRSDVPVGACLSGGLDSSSIVSMVRRIQGPMEKIHTFSSVFPSRQIDESVYIDELAARQNLLSSKNHPSVEEFLERIDALLFYQDLPFSGTSIFAQWKTFESAKAAKITVLLDGQGADESLLGYPGMLNGIIFDYLKKANFFNLIKFMKWQAAYNNQSFSKTFLLGLQQRFPASYRMALKLAYKDASACSLEKFDSLTDVCLSHFQINLPTLLRYEDRNSMAFSRESRLPFLDYRLVEFILSLPVDQRFRNVQTKWILRQTMKGINVESILNRKDKIGFATPEKEWWAKIKDARIFPEISGNANFKEFIFSQWLKNENFSR